MRGQQFECREHDPEGGVVRRFRAVWIPEARLVIHWDVPGGNKRVEQVERFPFGGDSFSAVALGPCIVPYRCVIAARRYLAQHTEITGRLPAIRLAIERYHARHHANDRHLQAALRELGR